MLYIGVKILDFTDLDYKCRLFTVKYGCLDGLMATEK